MARSIKRVFGSSTHDSGRIIVANKTLGDLEHDADIVLRNARMGRATLQKFSLALAKEVGRDPDTDFIQGPDKDRDRLIQKAVARYNGDVRQVSDPVRDMVTLATPQEVAYAKATLGGKGFRADQEEKGVKILAVEDFMEKGKASGWRGLVVKLEVDVGKGRKTRAELQMIPKDMLSAYAKTHPIQEESRHWEDMARAEGRALTRHESSTVEKHRFEARRIHSEAFRNSPFRVLDKTGLDASGQDFKIA